MTKAPTEPKLDEGLSLGLLVTELSNPGSTRRWLTKNATSLNHLAR